MEYQPIKELEMQDLITIANIIRKYNQRITTEESMDFIREIRWLINKDRNK